MFVLCCEIKIGSVSFKSVHDVKIKRSLYDLAATATVKVPVTAVLKHAGEPPTHIETAQVVKVGDKVLTSKYSGTEVKVDGEECTIVRQSDILAVVED